MFIFPRKNYQEEPSLDAEVAHHPEKQPNVQNSSNSSVVLQDIFFKSTSHKNNENVDDVQPCTSGASTSMQNVVSPKEIRPVCKAKPRKITQQNRKRFSNSKPKEKWVQCIQCKGWAHELCSDESAFFICVHCDSD
ncbi:hypothetical protein QE152_g26613 [Popillia japonica]|uniref:Uncharacterized protein n=1 Tax=Popillia japonica TaxID=7064 RepID=A0AAW1JWC5_POPJA